MEDKMSDYNKEACARATLMGRTSYRGYSLVRSPVDGRWRATKDGLYIYTTNSLDEAKRNIDEVIG
jgi:hypothetical protein